MRDNLTGIQPANDNLSEWRPTDNSALSLEDPLGGGDGDTSQETGAVHEYKDKLVEAATQAKDYLGEKATEIGGKIKDFTTDDLGGMANKAKDFARQKPGQAILVSAGIGLLLGLIVRGRR